MIGAVKLLLLVSVMWRPVRAGTLCSTVLDPAGLPVPNASITVVSLSDVTRQYRSQTDRNGNTCISNIAQGLYSVEASATGFLHAKYYPVRFSKTAPQKLLFQLPIGDVHEGGTAAEAVLSGTLKRADKVASGITICLYQADTLVGCDTTDDLGEYAIAVPPGVYSIDISGVNVRSQPRQQIDLSSPGMHRRIIFLQ